MADKTIPELEEIVLADGSSSFLVIDNGTQTYKIKPVNIPGLPRSLLVDLEVTSFTAGFDLHEAKGIAYADKAGNWKLDFNIAFNKATTSQSGFLEIEGILFAPDYHQALTIATTDAFETNCIARSGSNEIEFLIESTTTVVVYIQGSVMLSEKPTWYDGLGSGIDGFDIESEPGAVSSVNGQIGDVDLTTSEIPEGSRPYFTDSRARNAVVDQAILSGQTTKATSQDALFNALAAKQSTAQKNASNGYAGLDANGKLIVGQLPSSILGSLKYKGALDASLNAYPASPAAGDYWVIQTAGTISGIPYAVKDWAVYNGTSWDKLAGSAVSVTSVNNKEGAVTLTSDDITEGSANRYFTDVRARGAAVVDAINDGATTTAPSQNAVFDALASKEDKSAKGAASGYAPLGPDSLIPAEFLPAVDPVDPVGAGGLTPVRVTTTGNSAPNTVELVDVSAATRARTLPPLPLSGEDPISVSYIDIGFASLTNKVQISPSAGQQINLPGLAAGDGIEFRRPRDHADFFAAPGDTSWTVRLSSMTIVYPASAGTPGTVSQETSGIFTAGIGGALSSSCNCRFSVVGKNVVLEVGAIGNSTSFAAVAVFISVSAIAAYLPPYVLDYVTRVVVNNSVAATSCSIDPVNQRLAIASNIGGSAWTAGWTVNRWSTFILSWTL